MKKKTVLIIDDFEPLLEEVSDFLTFEGFKTYTATNGTQGVRLALQYKPDLILCDIEMPEMNGFEVYKTLEKIPATESVPFIFLTARAQAEDFKAGLKLGADDYITKPLEMDHLLASIMKRLNKLDKIKNIYRKEFEILLHNPLVGIFIYTENRFTLINRKFQEITGYSKNELNSVNLFDILISDTDIITKKVEFVLKGIYDSAQLKLSFIDKNKKAVFIEVFIKYIEIKDKKSLIGTIVKINPDSGKREKTILNGNAVDEFDKVVNFLISTGKKEIAEEIINVKEIVSFKEETKRDKIRQKIKLTKREKEILQLICEGYTNLEIADKLFISHRTVDNHRANLLSKTQTKNTALLVAFAVKNKLVNV